jgi:hypothetical protein
MTRITHLLKLRMTKAALILALFMMNIVAFAQEPVTLTVPTDQIFEEANNWIVTFAPIVAIGIGISIALAILTFIGSQIVAAFRK